jgi:hypothetical protein
MEPTIPDDLGDEIEVTTDLGTFAIVPDWLADSGVSDKALRLWIVLWQHADRRTGRAWPRREIIAKRVGCSVGHVRRLHKELEEVGGITVVQRWAEDGSQRSNMVTMHVTPRAPMNPPPRTHAQDPRAPMRDITRTKEQEPHLGAKAPRARDALFDALVLVCQIDPKALTSSARGAANRAIKELREVGAEPEQIVQAARAYRTRYPGAAVTPSALAKHWPSLLEGSPAPAQTAAPQCSECRGTGYVTEDNDERIVAPCSACS